MPASVKIRYGDVFSEPADVAVLPCSTDGVLKDFARRTREDFDLPAPPSSLELGGLTLISINVSGLRIRRLAYVAARDATGSSPEILRAIGTKLGELTVTQQGVTVVAAPLLGTGAGRVPLVRAVQATVEGFRATARPDATLSLCAPRRNSFKRLEDWYAAWRMTTRRPPRVFLSYNQATQASWVSGLHEFLTGQGVDAVVDRSALRLTMDLKSWMTQEIARAERVIIISDDVYARKADNHEGGVGEETCIIETDLLNHASTGKYIAVIRSKSLACGVPAYLRGRYVIECPSDEQTASVYQKVLTALYVVDEDAPPLGEPPVYV